MNHRLTAKLLGVAILLAIVGGGVYWQWTATGPEPVVGPSSAEAAPSITWTPGSLNEIIGQGQTKTVAVSFTSSEKLTNVVVRVVPELQPYVQVSPSSFASIAKGQTLSINVTIAAAATAPLGTATGTIQLRSGKGAPKTFAKPLPIEIMVTSPLPPDPGAAGKATLEGIDSDGDGLRDDVQRHIALTYPESERTRAGLIQAAKAMQALILNADDKQTSIANALEDAAALDCLYYLRPSDRDLVYDSLRAIVVNTPERARAYLRADGQLGGQVYESTPFDQRVMKCQFTPSLLPN
jgi:hypothetical protein